VGGHLHVASSAIRGVGLPELAHYAVAEGLDHRATRGLDLPAEERQQAVDERVRLRIADRFVDRGAVANVGKQDCALCAGFSDAGFPPLIMIAADTMKAVRCILLAIFSIWACAAAAQAPWPARAVKLIVPSSAGGGTDFFSRLLAHSLGETLKQQFVVENMPGGSGNLGAAAAARAAPDGYTFLVSPEPALAVNLSLFKNLPYNAERDFVPVARGVTVPLVLCAQASLGVRTLADLVEIGRRAPDKLTYGSSGSGASNYLTVRMIEEASGAKFLHVPYRGMGQALPGLLAGQVDFLLPDVAIALPHIKAGTLVPLALTHASTQLPSIPTIAEAGFPSIVVETNFSVVAPAGTPGAIVQRMNAEINKAMRSSPLAEKLAMHAFIPSFDTPEEFAAKLARDRAFWAAFIRRADIKPE
jgi:tripartite-type tricarboxylate transporter receptor subunit TctC